MAHGINSGDVVPSGYRAAQMKQFTPQQMNLFKNMFSQVGGGSYLNRLAAGDEALFEEMERPAMRQFGEMQGQLASRFSGMGMGARKGSGFANQANQQTSDFAMQLQSQRQGLQRQAINDLMGLSSDLLGQRPYDRAIVEKRQKQPTYWEELGLAVAPEVVKGAMNFIPKPGAGG